MDIVFEDEEDDRGGWGNKLVRNTINSFCSDMALISRRPPGLSVLLHLGERGPRQRVALPLLVLQERRGHFPPHLLHCHVRMRYPNILPGEDRDNFLAETAIVIFYILYYMQEVAAGQYLGQGGSTMTGQFVPILKGEFFC